jgi:glycosyltransferase involved in cell wall biosynthesis
MGINFLSLNCKVSIIVPVYNGERHLRQCLDSIINQTLKEIQIIIINDGSTDNSKEIISDYASKDGRILFIDCKNEGVSSARNKGIEKATGKYIGFVDADDYLDPEMYERLFEVAEEHNASLAICNATTVAGKKKAERLELRNECAVVSDNASLVLDFLSFKYDYANWNKIYALEIIKKYHLKFNENLAIWEDLLFNLEFIVYAQSIVTLSEGLYYYRVHDASVMADSKLLVSHQYNVFYDAYISFCNKHSLQLEKETFMHDRAKSCISTVFVLLKLRTRLNTSFLALSRQFGNELKVLNSDIYMKSRSSNRISVDFSWLLRYKFYRLFAFLYVSNYIIKNRGL